MMAKPQVQYRCSECGHISVSKLGKCPECGAWGSFVEDVPEIEVTARPVSRVPISGILPAEVDLDVAVENVQPEQRMTTDIEPWDEVLGGGLLYTSDAADDLLCVDLGGRRIINKKTNVDH